jgi:hypothetical protein
MSDTIQKTHHAQSDTNLALLNLIKQYGQCSYGLLFDQFGDLDLPRNQAHHKFARRLEYLLGQGRIDYSGRGRQRKFWLLEVTKPRPPALDPASMPALTAAQAAASYLGPKVPPRQVDVMHCDVYVPGPGLALRPGALDFKRHASHGDRC